MGIGELDGGGLDLEWGGNIILCSELVVNESVSLQICRRHFFQWLASAYSFYFFV